MRNKGLLLSIFLFGAATSSAQAMTITYQAVPSVITSNNSLAGTLHGQGGFNVSGSIPRLRVSPWSGTNASRPYNFVSRGYIAYGFRSLLKSVSFIWGSPDFFNMAEVASFGTSLSFVVPGNSPGAPPTNGQSYLVTLSADNASEYFNKLVMSSTVASFEFADVTGVPALSPVPIPAGLWLLGSGLFGLAGLARYRSVKRDQGRIC